MKKVAIVVLLLTLAMSARAEVQSLVGDGYWRLAVRPEFKVSDISGETAELGGVQVGPSLNRSLYTGIGWYGLVSSVALGDNGNDKVGALDFWYTGLVLDYTFAADKLFHGAINGLIGGGQVAAAIEGGGPDSADVFVAEPGVCLMMNLSSDIEFGIGAGYRFVNGSNIADLSDDDLDGPTGSVFFRWTEM